MNEKLHKALIEGTPSTFDEVSLAYIDASPTSGTVRGTLLLIHGFPETSYQFRHIIPRLVGQGYRVVAPDMRGAGYSSKPRDGFSKAIIAEDIYKLLTKHLNIKEKVHVIGHDIGGMVAHAYATRFEAHTKSVAWGECPLPGTTAYDKFLLEPGVWHFHFHWQADLPEALTQGREAAYMKHFFDRLSQKPQAITKDDLDYYAGQFAQPGAMRCGFDLYRGFAKDADDNRKWLKEHGKSKLPVTTLNGEGSILAQIAEEQAKEMYENVEVAVVEQSGHYCAEENPEDFTKKAIAFVEKYS